MQLDDRVPVVLDSGLLKRYFGSSASGYPLFEFRMITTIVFSVLASLSLASIPSDSNKCVHLLLRTCCGINVSISLKMISPFLVLNDARIGRR
jgi:hypothetical protein